MENILNFRLNGLPSYCGQSARGEAASVQQHEVDAYVMLSASLNVSRCHLSVSIGLSFTMMTGGVSYVSSSDRVPSHTLR